MCKLFLRGAQVTHIVDLITHGIAVRACQALLRDRPDVVGIFVMGCISVVATAPAICFWKQGNSIHRGDDLRAARSRSVIRLR